MLWFQVQVLVGPSIRVRNQRKYSGGALPKHPVKLDSTAACQGEALRIVQRRGRKLIHSGASGQPTRKRRGELVTASRELHDRLLGKASGRVQELQAVYHGHGMFDLLFEALRAERDKRRVLVGSPVDMLSHFDVPSLTAQTG